MNVESILMGLLGIAAGVFGFAFFAVKKQVASEVAAAKHEEQIKTLFINDKRQDDLISETLRIHRETMTQINKVLDQNALLIQQSNILLQHMADHAK